MICGTLSVKISISNTFPLRRLFSLIGILEGLCGGKTQQVECEQCVAYAPDVHSGILTNGGGGLGAVGKGRTQSVVSTSLSTRPSANSPLNRSSRPKILPAEAGVLATGKARTALSFAQLRIIFIMRTMVATGCVGAVWLWGCGWFGWCGVSLW